MKPGHAIVFAEHPVRLDDARLGFGLEPDGFPVRRKRRVEQPAEATGVHEAFEHFRIGAAVASTFDQASHRVLGPAEIDLDQRVQVVRDRKIWVDFDRAFQGVLGLDQDGRIAVDVFSQDPEDPAQLSPRRRIPRIGLHRPSIKIASHRPLSRVAQKLVPSQEVFVRRRARGHIALHEATLARGQRR